jgi:ATP-dependent DNA helicase RecG
MAENQNIEYKESWRTEYLKWVCGFANAQGGTIYIGVNDKGKLIGLPKAKKLMEDIPNQIQSGLGFVADVILHEKDGLEYIEIKVNPSSFPVSYHGEYHYRSGNLREMHFRNSLCARLVSAGKMLQLMTFLLTTLMARVSRYSVAKH